MQQHAPGRLGPHLVDLGQGFVQQWGFSAPPECLKLAHEQLPQLLAARLQQSSGCSLHYLTWLVTASRACTPDSPQLQPILLALPAAAHKHWQTTENKAVAF